MVLLTVTPSIADALKQVNEQHKPDGEHKPDTQYEADEPSNDADQDQSNDAAASSSTEPAVGNPISHSDLLSLYKKLNASESEPKYSLEQLLRGSQVYVPPSPPKPEPSKEYKALMARLRRDEDARAYERMINPPLPLETFSSRFPNAAHAFAEANRPSKAEDLGDDEITYNEVQRQVMLIINFLVSIVGVAATLWIAGRWWSLSARVFLTLGGSIVVAIAEVAVYSSYMWRMGEAKSKQGAVKEIKEVVQSWVVGQEGEDDGDKSVLLQSKAEDESVRRRIPTISVTESP